MIRLLSTFSMILLMLSSSYVAIAQNTDSSVLSTGDIYKISVEQTGIHKIDYNFLSSIDGLNVDAIDPRNIHIYGNEGGPVPQAVNSDRIDDLADNAIMIVGESDGSFDQNDYIILYTEGPSVYRSNSDNELEYHHNPYDRKNFYYIKVEDTAGPRVQTIASIDNPDITSDTRESIQRHEVDKLNLLGNFGGTQGSGKEWYGESFANETSQNFSFNFPDIVPNSEAEIAIRLAGRDEGIMRYNVTVAGQSLSQSVNSTITGNIEETYAKIGNLRDEITLTDSRVNVAIDFVPHSNQSEGWLDYIEIKGIEKNRYSNTPIYIHDAASVDYDTYGYSISQAGNIQVWDITVPQNTRNIELVGTGNKIFAFETESKLKTFIAFEPGANHLSPSFVNKVENQNLHGIQEADFIIVSHPNFLDAAERLAQHRLNNDGLNVVIADIFQIYNEYSSGRVDPTAIRDFCKMVHDRDPNFTYLLLLGDASYDYRGLNEQLEYQNYVPTYETDQSLDPVEAFPSDDYFGLLSAGEGQDRMEGGLELGIGRIPCRTENQANNVIDKIIHYDTSADVLGDWRTRIGFTADDEDRNLHIRDADSIAKDTEDSHPEYVQQKVYFDAFNQVSTPGGARYPDANAQLNANIDKGQLVLNYLGHGGPKGWAQERVLQIGDILNWQNKDKLPVIITATCSFTGFDEPSFVSAGEQALLNPNGGGIALFTTVRAVYTSSNKRLTSQVFENIFVREQGVGRRLGDIMRMAQNEVTVGNTGSTIIPNTRKFLLMGDPTQQIALPKYKVAVASINGIPIDEQSVDTISALENVIISGVIAQQENDNIISDFNGTINLTVFDKYSELRTLDNDDRSGVFDFNLRKSVLYKGSAVVTNGQFSIELVLPRDIDFDYGAGMLSFYASDGMRSDAIGEYDKIIIGGTSPNIIVDDEGPIIDIFLDDRTFVDGGTVSDRPALIIDLSDETGINLSSTSIGHDITAELDNDISNNIVLNDFYTPTIGQVGQGTVTYQLDLLEPGLHSVTIKAWDILNNSSDKSAEFFVAENIEGFVSNVLNYPNPFAGITTFAFEHSLGSTEIDISIDIFTLNGQLITTIKDQRFSAGNTVDGIRWDSRENFGTNIPTGIYLYKIKVESIELDVSNESDFYKLVITN